MPEGKKARPEGRKCRMTAFLPEAIFKFVLTVEEYVFALSERKSPKNCETARNSFSRARKSARNYANDFFFHSSVLIFHFICMLCRERTCVKEQKHILLFFLSFLVFFLNLYNQVFLCLI